MGAEPRSSGPIAIDPSRSALWTLHHVLLDRIERANAACRDGTDLEVPPVAVYRAFDRIDAGGTQFTADELEAIRSVLAEYHRSTGAWEADRRDIEALLAIVSSSLESH